MVDDCDFERISQFKWSVDGKQPYLYARTHIPLGNGKRSHPSMHRMVMNAPRGLDVDHINHNTLDNRRTNLRLATRSQTNQNNLGGYAVSGYKGVFFEKERNCWRAHITLKEKTKYLGRFATVIEGAIAYNNAAKKYFGEFACLNKIP